MSFIFDLTCKDRILSSNCMLRQLEEADATALFRVTEANRAYLRKTLPWLDFCTKEEDSLAFIQMAHHKIKEGKSLTFGILFKEEIVGVIGFHEIDFVKKEADIGYWVAENYQGKGLVTLSCKALMNIGFFELKLNRIYISCGVTNSKSQAVAAKVGCKKYDLHPHKEELYGVYVDHKVFYMDKEEWQKMNMPLSKSAQSIQDVLSKKGCPFKVIELSQSTRTAKEAADAIGCSIAQIIKSLLFRTKETHKPVLILASGINRVNEKAIETLVGEKIEKADADFTRKVTGFAIGGIPPVGHLQQIDTFIDEDLLTHKEVWAAAGTPYAVFSLKSEDIKNLTNGTVILIK